MRTWTNSTIKLLAVMAVTAIPVTAVAGGYGSTAVRDATVGQTAGAGPTVFCPRMGQEVPQRLASQMDCGTATATPQVLDDRVSNTDRGGFFDRFRHQPNSNRRLSDNLRDNDGGSDPDTPRVVASDDPTPTTPSDSSDDPTPTTDGNGPTPKWDRLNELGVTRDNFEDQSDSFREQFRDYRRGDGQSGDWSGFNPTE